MRSISRACGLLATLVPLALAIACGDPELASELDSEGPPEVLEVNVASETALSDPNQNAIEAATFCREGEEFKVSEFYCPLARDGENAPIPGARAVEGPILDATPADWTVRFIFSELLDPDIEDLVEADGVVSGSLAETQPFTLTCGGADIAYDGWYDPSGNHLSFPAGPSLVVAPTVFVATGTADCEVSLKEGVVDKDGDEVPGDDRGPYTFGVAPLSVGGTAPADEEMGVDPASAISIPFNAPIDLASVDGKITVSNGKADIVVEIDYLLDPKTGEVADDTTVVVTPVDPLAPDTTYTVSVLGGITDIAAGPLAEGVDFTFTTGAGE